MSNGEKGELSRRFTTEDSQRSDELETWRECAALSIKTLLPQEKQISLDHKISNQLHYAYQNLGNRNVITLGGKYLEAVFPTFRPWFIYEPTPQLKYDPSLPPEALTAFSQELYIRELALRALIDQSNMRAKMRMNILNNIVTGNWLAEVRDDYNLKTYRSDQWTSRRDSAYEVMHILIREVVDVRELPRQVIAMAGLDIEEVNSKTDPKEREFDFYTFIERQYSNTGPQWLIRQELNGKQVGLSQDGNGDYVDDPIEEQVNPYLSGTWEEVAGSPYGEGMMESNLPDFRTYNAFEKNLLDGGAIAALAVPVVDDVTGTTSVEDLLTAQTGIPISGRVNNGKPADIGFLTVDKNADFQFVILSQDRVEKRLGKAFASDIETQPTGERVTAFQSAKFAQELESSLGSLYGQNATTMQRPYIERIIWMAEQDGILTKLPKDSAVLRTLSGLETVKRQLSLQQTLEALQVMGQVFGPEALNRLRPDEITRRVIEGTGEDPVGLFKTDEELAADEQRRQALLAQQTASQQAIASTGKIAEKAAEQAGSQQPAA